MLSYGFWGFLTFSVDFAAGSPPTGWRPGLIASSDRHEPDDVTSEVD